MGTRSKIQWTDHTFNPWWGCTKMSAACDNCYAARIAHRFKEDIWGKESPRLTFGEAHWNAPRRWNHQAQKSGIPQRVLCGSMCDVFELRENARWNMTIDRQRMKLWDLIDETPHLIWMLLTKRPFNIGYMLPKNWVEKGLPQNVWFGVSAENQEMLEERWSDLDWDTHYRYPSVLFLSLEPLLGPIDLEDVLIETDIGDEDHQYWTRHVDWVIVGGETGPGARPMLPEWVRGIRDLCQEAEVPFFFKQWGPIKRAGRLLDGREWNEIPEEGR